MWNLKKNYKDEHTYKTNRLTDIENKLMVTKGERVRGGINLEFGINRYTLLCIKLINIVTPFSLEGVYEH